jgi:hypothetical protein
MMEARTMSCSVAPKPQVLQKLSQVHAQRERDKAMGRDVSAPEHELPDMQSELHEPDEDDEDGDQHEDDEDQAQDEDDQDEDQGEDDEDDEDDEDVEAAGR